MHPSESATPRSTGRAEVLQKSILAAWSSADRAERPLSPKGRPGPKRDEAARFFALADSSAFAENFLCNLDTALRKPSKYFQGKRAGKRGKAYSFSGQFEARVLF